MADNYQGHRDFVMDPKNHKLWIIDFTNDADGKMRKLCADSGMTAVLACMTAGSDVGGGGRGNYSLPPDYSAHQAFVMDPYIIKFEVDLRIQSARELVWRFGITPAHNEVCTCNCTGTLITGNDPGTPYVAPKPNYDLPVEEVIVYPPAQTKSGASRGSGQKKVSTAPSLFDQPKPDKKPVALKPAANAPATPPAKKAVKKAAKKVAKKATKKAAPKKATKKVAPKKATKKAAPKKATKKVVAKKVVKKAAKKVAKKAVAKKATKKAVAKKVIKKAVKKATKKVVKKAAKKAKGKRK